MPFFFSIVFLKLIFEFSKIICYNVITVKKANNNIIPKGVIFRMKKANETHEVLVTIIMGLLPIVGPLSVILPWITDYHPAIKLIASVVIVLILSAVVSWADAPVETDDDDIEE